MVDLVTVAILAIAKVERGRVVGSMNASLRWWWFRISQERRICMPAPGTGFSEQRIQTKDDSCGSQQDRRTLLASIVWPIWTYRTHHTCTQWKVRSASFVHTRSSLRSTYKTWTLFASSFWVLRPGIFWAIVVRITVRLDSSHKLSSMQS